MFSSCSLEAQLDLEGEDAVPACVYTHMHMHKEKSSKRGEAKVIYDACLPVGISLAHHRR